VVDGEKSATGKPILASDPHLGLTIPAVWYEAHIVVPGELDVNGFTIPGIPQIIIGHNSHIAWASTNVAADVVDVFVEEINPSNPDQYMNNGEWLDFETVEEIIRVKNGRDVRLSVKYSVHGPLIDSMITTFNLDVEDMPNLAMNWTGHSVTTNLVSLSLSNKANNLNDAFDALYYWDVPAQNIFYADDQGNIAATCAGRFPVRSGYSGKYPVKALNDSVGIVGYIPYNYLPRSLNPSQHFLQSANQRPIDLENYEYELPAITWYDPGYRGRRIHDLLLNDYSVTIEDMMVFQADSLDLRAQIIVPYVIDAWENSGIDDSEIQSVVDVLDEWDYVLDTNEAMPTFWEYLVVAISELTFDEVEGIFWFFIPKDPVLEELVVTNSPYYFNKQDTPQVETRDDILVESLGVAYESLVDDFGSNMDGWLWGNHHKLTLYHEGGFGTITRGGSRGGNVTVNVASWGFGPSARMVVDLSSIENSYGVYPGGQSGSPSSPHYDDLLDIYYTFNETTQHYGYHDMYYYPTASGFVDSDTDSSMIENVIRFEKKAETNIDDISEEEPYNESNGWIPGYPLLSIALAILLVIIIFYMKQNQ
jgi:penicillin amidase